MISAIYLNQALIIDFDKQQISAWNCDIFYFRLSCQCKYCDRRNIQCKWVGTLCFNWIELTCRPLTELTHWALWIKRPYLICVREVLASNLGWDNNIAAWNSLWLSSVPSGICWDSALELGHNRLSVQTFQFLIHYYPTTCYWQRP
jgi:hypothetical protein